MPDHDGHEKLLHTRKQTAHQLSVSLRTVDGLIRSKELRVRTGGSRVLIHRGENPAGGGRRDHETRVT